MNLARFDYDPLQPHLDHGRQQLLAVAGQHLARQGNHGFGIAGADRGIGGSAQCAAQCRLAGWLRPGPHDQPGVGVLLGLDFFAPLSGFGRIKSLQLARHVDWFAAFQLIAGEVVGEPRARARNADIGIGKAFGSLGNIADQIHESSQLLLVGIVHRLEHARKQLIDKTWKTYGIHDVAGCACDAIDRRAGKVAASILRNG